MNELAGRKTLKIPKLPERASDSHKGDFGTALLVGGSRGMTGAIGLAGCGALRGGAGKVRLATPLECLYTVAGYEPCYMTVPLPADSEGRIDERASETIVKLCESATAVAIGPGLGRSPALARLVGWLYREIKQPLVVDADALTALAIGGDSLGEHAGPRILTPHPGEFAALALKGERVDRAMQEEWAVELAQASNIVIVLKGSPTLVTDGLRWARNATGNPGLATGGTGDVLTGLVTALLCQGMSPWDSARLGVHLHGLAGDLAAAELGQVAMIASDVVRFFPKAFGAS